MTLTSARGSNWTLLPLSAIFDTACLHISGLESQAHCMTMATVLPKEGGTGKFATDRVLEVECGNQTGDMVIKTHQELAIKLLAKDIVVESGHDHRRKTSKEESLVGSHGSNDIVEKPVQTIEGQARVMKLALESSVWTMRRG